MNAIDQLASCSWKTSSSSSPGAVSGATRREYPRADSRASTRALVADDTSLRPLSTFEIVDSETCASAAMSASVTRGGSIVLAMQIGRESCRERVCQYV